MAAKQQVSVRVDQGTRAALEAIAKQRRMASSDACTITDLVREALAQYIEQADVPLVISRCEAQRDLFE